MAATAKVPAEPRAAVRMVEPAFLDRESAAQFLALGVTTFCDLVRKGQIAKPRQLSGNRVGWLYTELLEFATSRPVADLLPPPNAGNRKGKGKRAANDESAPS